MFKFCKYSLVAALVVLAGCAQQHNADRVIRLDAADNIVVTDMRSTTTNGLLVVATTLRNTDSSDDTALYRFKWSDATGMTASGSDAWTPQLIYSNQSVQIRGVAPNAKMTDFVLELSR